MIDQVNWGKLQTRFISQTILTNQITRKLHDTTVRDDCATMSSFTGRRTIENCLMSARNMRAAAHAPCSQRALSMFTAQILNSRLVSRCSRIGGAHRVTCNSMVAPRRWRWLVDEGRSLSMMSHVFVLFTDLYNHWLRFVHSITKKQGTLVMAITHSFQSILTTDGSIRILVAISYVRCTVAAARQRLSWYTDGISHEFHKNGKTYQNTDSMSLLEMKQLFM